MGEVIRLRVASSQEAITLQSASGSLAVEAVSPRVSFEKVDGGTRLDITDIDGTKSAILPDGAIGPIGPSGATGPAGIGIVSCELLPDYRLMITYSNGTYDIVGPIRGAQGEIGPIGPSGTQGPSGVGIVYCELLQDYRLQITYSNGTYDIVGPVRGPQGETGTAGQDGNDGADGVTFTPSVSSEGVLSWTNDGGRTNPQSVNIRGLQGPAGSDATVTVDNALSDTSVNPVQNKVIAAELQDIRDDIASSGFVPISDPMVWEANAWYKSTGGSYANINRIRTTAGSQLDGFDYYIEAESGLSFLVLFYNGSTYINTDSQWVRTCNVKTVVPSGATCFRLVVRTTPEQDLRNAVETTAAKVHFYRVGKVDVDQGVENAGKVLVVGANGMVSPQTYDPVTVETVSGTDPVITGVDNHRYICGTCDTLTLTPPSSGIVDVVFTSGTTPTVLTVTPPSGKTMLWPGWFNPSTLDASTIYEINIMDGVYGAVAAWT